MDGKRLGCKVRREEGVLYLYREALHQRLDLCPELEGGCHSLHTGGVDSLKGMKRASGLVGSRGGVEAI